MKHLHTNIADAILRETIDGKNFVVQDFFVGLTDDPNNRLFNEHKVDKKKDLYVYFKASSTEEAQNAFDELFQLDMNGEPPSNYKAGKYVYCYHINGNTVECPNCN